MLVLIFSVLILVMCIGIILCGRQNYGTLENCGFPVVTPSLFLGSNPNLHKKVQHLVDIERFKKYGGIWGVSTVFQAIIPTVHSSTLYTIISLSA